MENKINEISRYKEKPYYNISLYNYFGDKINILINSTFQMSYPLLFLFKNHKLTNWK